MKFGPDKQVCHVFLVIWYLDKDKNIPIFEIECGRFWKIVRKIIEI